MGYGVKFQMSIANSFYNDVTLIPLYLLIFLWGLIILFASIITHELGHALYFLIRKKRRIKVRLHWKGIMSFKFLAGNPEDYKNLTDKEYVHINLWGILLGMFPIIIASAYYSPMILMLFPYFVGCKQDLKVLFSQIEEEVGSL